MKISKKIFAVLLSVVLVLSVFAISAAAEGETEAPFMTVSILTNKGTESYEPGENVTVSVKIACNYNATTVRFPIMYDSRVLQAPTIVDVAGVNTCAEWGSVLYNKSSATNNFIPEEYDSSEWGCLLVQWTTGVKNGQLGCLNNPEGEIAFQFTLKVKNDATSSGTIFIPAESTLFYNQYIVDPADATTISYLKDMSSVLSFVPADVTLAGGDETLIPNADYNSQSTVDEDNLWVYGVEEGIFSADELLPFVVPSDPNATLEAEATDNGYGTGTLLNVVKGGNVLRTYTLVIFGDLNGDCVCDANDLPTYTAVTSGTETIEEAFLMFAGDLNNDGDIDANDLPNVTQVTSGATVIDQTNPY